jgi:hypothetical protein
VASLAAEAHVDVFGNEQPEKVACVPPEPTAR